MRDGMFIFDNVVHAFDLTTENAAGTRVRPGHDHSDLVVKLAASYGTARNGVNAPIKGSAITAQRAYQANAQTIKTQDSVLQTLVNLR